MVFLVGASKDFYGVLSPSTFDFVFIDGCHEYESVKQDIVLALSCLKLDGQIALHDYELPGVSRAIGELLKPAIETVQRISLHKRF